MTPDRAIAEGRAAAERIRTEARRASRAARYVYWFGTHGTAWTTEDEDEIMAEAERIAEDNGIDSYSPRDMRKWALDEAVSRLGAKAWLVR